MRRIAPICSRSARRAPGTVYLIVLLSVLILTVIGLSGLYVAQVQGRVVSEGCDTQQARALAEAAVEVGATMINDDPTWRATYGGGDWIVQRPFGDGFISVNVTDPDDGDVTDDGLDPIILRGVGEIRDARQMVEVRLDGTPGSLNSLGSAAHAGRIMAFDAARVTSDAELTSNDSTWASSAVVNADVESAGAIIGAVYNGEVKGGQAARDLPNESEVISLWEALGTPLTPDEIAAESSNLVANGDVDYTTDFWTADDCSLSINTTAPHDGPGNLYVFGRLTSTSSPVQDVTALVANGQSYDLSMWAKKTLLVSCTVRLCLVIEENDGDIITYKTTPMGLTVNWMEITGTVTPAWNGADGLKSALVCFETAGPTVDMHLDSISITPTSLPDPVIEEVVLTPTFNPYGGATSASEGVYVIDCAGRDLIIRNCRITSTLVVLDPGAGSMVDQSVVWEAPAGRPALIVRGDMLLQISDDDLDESVYAANFNPTGAGLDDEDDDVSDQYPPGIEGLVYSTNDLTIADRTDITGVMIADRDIIFQGDNVIMTHMATYQGSPPVGFTGAERMVLDRRSWTKVVD